MEKQLIQLKERREELSVKLRQLVDTMTSEDRDFDETESKQFDSMEAEVKELDAKIERAEKAQRFAEADAKKRAPQEKKTPEQKLAASFSLSRAINTRMRRDYLEGAEREMHEEAHREAKASGIQDMSPGGIALPSWAMKAVTGKQKRDMQQRAHTVGSPASMGNLVQTDYREHIPALTPEMQVLNLGAELWSGLTGNIQMTRETNQASSSWVGETDASVEQTITTEKVNLVPHRLTAFAKQSRQLLAQTSGLSDQIIGRNLENAISLGVDLAAINGSGIGDVPLGLLNTSGVNAAYAGGAALVGDNPNGAALVRADLVNAEKLVAVQNAQFPNMKWLTNPKVRAALKNIKVDAGSGRFLWEDMAELLGYPALVSTQVPSDLVKGASGATLSAMIFGDWSKLIVAQWAGIDIILDEVTLASQAEFQLFVHSWWDFGVRYPQAFTHFKDIVTA